MRILAAVIAPAHALDFGVALHASWMAAADFAGGLRRCPLHPGGVWAASGRRLDGMMAAWRGQILPHCGTIVFR
jgi:hypothetical protein